MHASRRNAAAGTLDEYRGFQRSNIVMNSPSGDENSAILQNVDRDGERDGYDGSLISAVSTAVNVPVVALGGAGQFSHLVQGLRFGASAVASGSTFVFIGRLRAVLITYPSPHDVKQIFANGGAFSSPNVL